MSEVLAPYTPEKPTIHVRMACDKYYEEYGAECSRVEWEEVATHADRMSFASTYGKLTPRQSAAVEFALDVYKDDEYHSQMTDVNERVVPLEAALWADRFYFDPKFRPDLTDEPSSFPDTVTPEAISLAAMFRTSINVY
jgi:hypothetical protein